MTRFSDTLAFMHALFDRDVSRRSILEMLLDDERVGSVAGEHGVDRAQLVAALSDESSTTGAQLRRALDAMRAEAPNFPGGAAFPPDLTRATDGALELIGLYANPLTTIAMIYGQPVPPFEAAAKMIVRDVPLTHYASRVLRVLAYEYNAQKAALENAANALETLS